MSVLDRHLVDYDPDIAALIDKELLRQRWLPRSAAWRTSTRCIRRCDGMTISVSDLFSWGSDVRVRTPSVR